MKRKSYGNHSGNSPIRSYAASASSIRIWFEDGGIYEYDDSRPGHEHVQAMMRLAEQGNGLATYINRHVRKNYARKL